MLFRWQRRSKIGAERIVRRNRSRGRTGLSRYAGDFRPDNDGRSLRVEYAPHPDGLPDPGEVVWTWVPFEEDPAQGKDRPVLIIGRDGPLLLGLMLTSKDHDRDVAAQAQHGRHWLDIGTGAWDGQRRPSEVRLDRILRLRSDEVRREGAALSREVFDRVAQALKG